MIPRVPHTSQNEVHEVCAPLATESSHELVDSFRFNLVVLIWTLWAASARGAEQAVFEEKFLYHDEPSIASISLPLVATAFHEKEAVNLHSVSNSLPLYT